MRSLISIFLALLMICTMAAGASALSSQEQEAVDIGLAWLALVDQGKYDQSWQEAASYFRGAVKQAQWADMAGAVRKPLGEILSRKVTSITAKSSLPGAPDGKYWIIVFATSFRNKKEAVETLTLMKDTDGKWRAAGYYIR